MIEPGTRVRPPRAAVLMFHRISDHPPDWEEGDYVISPPVFESQMRTLAAAGPPVIDLDALALGCYPDRAVVLTFDDGSETDASVAAPLLHELGFAAAFFVNPARVGREGRASWDQLREMTARGFLIGSHGLDHTLLDGLSHCELRRQLQDSKLLLEDRLQRPVEALSLPGGTGGTRALRAARESGYRFIFGSRPAPVRGPSGSLEILPRFAVRRGHGLQGFRAVTDQERSFLLWQALRYRAARVARSLVGSGAYARLRLLWVDRSGRSRRA